MCTFDVHGTVVHALSPNARPAGRGDLPTRVLLGVLLAEAGFDERVGESFDYGKRAEMRWWEGEVLGEPVTVALDDCRPGDVGLALAIDEEPSRIYNGVGDDEWDLRDAISDEWGDWAGRHGKRGAWAVWDGTVWDPVYSTLSASYGGSVPETPDAGWLDSVLDDGVAACTRAAAEFAEYFDIEGTRRQLEDERNAEEAARVAAAEAEEAARVAAAEAEEAARVALLDGLAGRGSRKAELLGAYLGAVDGSKQLTWDVRDEAERALAAVGATATAAEMADFLSGPLANALWSKRLRQHLVSRWTGTDQGGQSGFARPPDASGDPPPP